MDHPLDSLEVFLSNSSEDFIFDSNVLTTSDLSRHIYSCFDISTLDISVLERGIEYLQKTEDILSKFGNVYTLEEVREEERRFLQICNEKYDWLKRVSKSNRENLEIFDKFNFDLFKLIKSTKHRELRPHGRLYPGMLQCISMVSRDYDTQKDYKDPQSYGKRGEKRREFQYLDTDEKLIAAAFDRALAEKKEISIVTNDHMLWGKFGLVYRLLTCKELNNRIEGLKEYNLRVIGISEGKYDIVKQTSKFNDKEYFYKGGVGESYLNKFKEIMENALQIT